MAAMLWRYAPSYDWGLTSNQTRAHLSLIAWARSRPALKLRVLHHVCSRALTVLAVTDLHLVKREGRQGHQGLRQPRRSAAATMPRAPRPSTRLRQVADAVGGAALMALGPLLVLGAEEGGAVANLPHPPVDARQWGQRW